VASIEPLKLRSGTGFAAVNSSALNANAAVASGGPVASQPASPVTAAGQRSNQTAPAAAEAPRIDPGAERPEVYRQVASANINLATAVGASMPTAPAPNAREAKMSSGRERSILLSQAIGAAVLSHPLMGAQGAKVTGALADVRTAEGGTKPQLQVYAGSGGSYLGSYSNYGRSFGSVDIPGGSRSDAGFTLRQLVYDFGAAKADIARSKSVVSAERLRLADQAEDIALRTANAYFNLLEQSELIGLMDKVVADDNKFASLVQLNEKQGNGTVADVNRIKSKVIEVEAIRTDITTSLRTAQDEFYRLTKLDPDMVHRAAANSPRVPPTFEVAFETAQQSNPSLLALSANGTSLNYQLASQQAQRLPRIDLQGDGLVKHYTGSSVEASQGIVDSRLMLMVSYKLLDGGTMAAQSDRIREDKRANDFRTLDERESIELNLKRFYQALSANRIKETAAIQGISTAEKANSLYLEQFKAGKRTVFEVLDSRMVVFTMQKNAVNGKYEQLRATYGILRNMGKLVETAIRQADAASVQVAARR
jgi:outer membrane protein, adhesin transport system